MYQVPGIYFLHTMLIPIGGGLYSMAMFAATVVQGPWPVMAVVHPSWFCPTIRTTSLMQQQFTFELWRHRIPHRRNRETTVLRSNSHQSPRVILHHIFQKTGK